MKYVIMFTSTPELDAAVPPERAQEVYGRIFQWFRSTTPIRSRTPVPS